MRSRLKSRTSGFALLANPVTVAYSHSFSPAQATATPFSTRLPHLSPIISALESPERCEDYNSQTALLEGQEQGRLGMPCLQRAFPLAKKGRVGGGVLACPNPWLLDTAILSGSLLLQGCPALDGPMVQVEGGEKRRDRQPRCLGSGSAWGRAM